MNKLMEKSTPFQWVLTFITISFITIGIIFSLNYIVDPFGTRNWLIEKHYKPIVHERSEKFTYLFNQEHYKQYDCLILGSSRVMSISPKTLEETKGCYNFGVHVANNPEKLFILQEWLKRAPLKKVYIGNELYNVHALNRPNYLNPHSFIGGSEGNYLSFATLLISLKAIKYTLKNEQQTHFRDDGSLIYAEEEKAIINHTFNHSKQHFRQLSSQAVNSDYLQSPFHYDHAALEPLKKIKVLCDQHHIQLFAFLTPTYIEFQNSIKRTPNLAKETQVFQNDLINIFGTLYNFDLNNSTNSKPSHFYDPVHYRPSIGKLMIEKMNNRGNYGVILIKP